MTRGSETLGERIARLQADVVILNAASQLLREQSAEQVRQVREHLAAAQARREGAAAVADPGSSRNPTQGNG